jgi:hypothetical protein
MIAFALYGLRKELYLDWAVLLGCHKPANPYEHHSMVGGDDHKLRPGVAFTSKASSPHGSMVGKGPRASPVAGGSDNRPFQVNRVSIASPAHSKSPRQSLAGRHAQQTPVIGSEAGAKSSDVPSIEAQLDAGLPNSPTTAVDLQMTSPPATSGVTSPTPTFRTTVAPTC